MHELVLRISEPEKCYVFARNAQRSGHPELARQAFRRAVDLRAEKYPTRNEVEFVGVRAIYAYEEAMSLLKGKRTRATGTWQMVSRYGVVSALQKRLESRNGSNEVTPALKELGMEDYSFEAVRDAFPEAFAQQAA